MATEQIWIRDYIKEIDWPFIYNTWSQSHRNAGFNQYLDYPQYAAIQKPIIRDIMERDTVSAKVVCLEQDHNTLIGFVCHESVKAAETEVHFVHYIYVKQMFRRNNLAKMLLNKAGFDLQHTIIGSHASYINRELQHRYRIVYMPELIRGI